MPHRAWEEGYQSLFARTSHRLLDPGYEDPQLRPFQYPAEPPSINSRAAPTKYSLTPASEASIQPALPLSSAIPNSQIKASTNSEHSALTPTTKPSISYQPRMRRVITKLLIPDDLDISDVVNLGMSPFMAGQDMIANQNRIVHNECVFARHLLRLQHATADYDARHAKTEQDTYEHLERHMFASNRLGGGSNYAIESATGNTENYSVRADPDFITLERAHLETRTRLEVLSRQISESSESIRHSLMGLAQRLDQVLAESRASI